MRAKGSVINASALAVFLGLCLCACLAVSMAETASLESLESLAGDDPEAALEQAAEALEAAELAGDQARVAELEYFRASLFVDQDQSALASQAYERAVSGFRDTGDESGELRALQGLGSARASAEEYDGALEAFYNGLRVADRLDDREATAELQTRIGEVHFYSGDVDAAEVYFQRQRESYDALDHQQGYASALNNLAVIARHRDELDRARDLNERAAWPFANP